MCCWFHGGGELQGFERVFSEMSDIVIDVPAAYTVLDRIFEKCTKEGNFLPEKVSEMRS